MMLREQERTAENCLDFRRAVGYGTPPERWGRSIDLAGSAFFEVLSDNCLNETFEGNKIDGKESTWENVEVAAQ